MDRISTTNQLILKIYGELNQKEEQDLNTNIDSNEQYLEELSDYNQVVSFLKTFEANPNDTSVQLILEESLKSALETH